eukprot:Nitzschia sp. Nitz4//scaffold50_size126154//59645//61288//NITZ4_003685-RA/size126154-processed-gene-0.172-mRNA-1//-1//CDS//3329553698//1942//frame0
MNTTSCSNPSNIRHAEKRRTATCRFADRVAQVSVDHYRRVVPPLEQLEQTCVSTIVAHYKGQLSVLSMGVGTKFLSSQDLEDPSSPRYGRRLRDCHAEVLARRGLRRYLTLQILQDLRHPATLNVNQPTNGASSILIRANISSSNGTLRYQLKPGVTLHLYSSSAPCGNATLKKFAKMTKERFQEGLGPDEWPDQVHPPMHASSIHLGQVALLVKKDPGSPGGNEKEDESSSSLSSSSRKAAVLNKLSKKEQTWPANTSDDWTPPGTTIVTMPHKGSIHTCSDKIARWNCLGLQGSLLSSLLEEPLYLSSVVVGRKFTSIICQRALCCRWGDVCRLLPRNGEHATASPPPPTNRASTLISPTHYRVNHPSLMGTAVYLDETGTVETNADVQGQDVRFHSSQSWCWWLDDDHVDGHGHGHGHGTSKNTTTLECIHGSTGYLYSKDQSDKATVEGEQEKCSQVSTAALTELFVQAQKLARQQKCTNNDGDILSMEQHHRPLSLQELRRLKQNVAGPYETIKESLLTKHRVFRGWRRRCYEMESNDHMIE